MSQDHFDQLYPMRVEMEKKKPQKSSATVQTHTESSHQQKQKSSFLKTAKKVLNFKSIVSEYQFFGGHSIYKL